MSQILFNHEQMFVFCKCDTCVVEREEKTNISLFGQWSLPVTGEVAHIIKTLFVLPCSLICHGKCVPAVTKFQ